MPSPLAARRAKVQGTAGEEQFVDQDQSMKCEDAMAAGQLLSISLQACGTRRSSVRRARSAGRSQLRMRARAAPPAACAPAHGPGMRCARAYFVLSGCSAVVGRLSCQHNLHTDPLTQNQHTLTVESVKKVRRSASANSTQPARREAPRHQAPPATVRGEQKRVKRHSTGFGAIPCTQ